MIILPASDDSEFPAAALQPVGSQFDPESAEVLDLHALDRYFLLAGLTPVDPSALERLLEDERRAGEVLVQQAQQAPEAASFRAESAVEEGDAQRVILDAASRWKPELIVLGSRGLKGFHGLLTGSVAEPAARHAPCSVEIVRRRAGR